MDSQLIKIWMANLSKYRWPIYQNMDGQLVYEDQIKEQTFYEELSKIINFSLILILVAIPGYLMVIIYL